MYKSPKGKLLRAVRRIAALSAAAVMLCTAAPLAASANDAENRLSDPEWTAHVDEILKKEKPPGVTLRFVSGDYCLWQQ